MAAQGHARACAEAFRRVLASTPSLPCSRRAARLLGAVHYCLECDDAAYLRLKTAASATLLPRSASAS